jgi:hypothetical protein
MYDDRRISPSIEGRHAHRLTLKLVEADPSRSLGE